MYSLYTKFVKILEICKQVSENLVNEFVDEFGNIPYRSPISKFSSLEVVALYNMDAADAGDLRHG